ncbi:MAG: UDP-N-acetylmuramoyl-L-alanyl-D-glutamate--2,6-diaminopimelate ligase [Elusimicrobiota bacterium]|jgi:UDP-N-acetylmuramoyl-L-alanyl-D-glutamate--2,6-diaminopimelate ligase|nr:UDP-N-acetylmuramoyl-L-alanyl-D-glutamate--2,6-diaminopimelate ligase [Elusimicrobiota bacterium]
MKLKEIFPFEDVLFFGNKDIEIKGVSYDSRKVEKGFAFFALGGHFTDGKIFIKEAVAKGASLIISDTRYENLSVSQIVVKDVFAFMGIFCAKFYNHPDKEMKIIGITGTNGKTTVSYMIESILSYAKIECGVIGTINYRYKGKVMDSPNTTPQSADLFAMMRDMLDDGVKYLVMEVSSHGLALGRTAQIDFDTAVWTNLTQDHLDFHKNIEDYFEAKSLLFKNLSKGIKDGIKTAVINADDQYGLSLANLSNDVKTVLYSTKPQSKADFKAENIAVSNSGSSFDLLSPDGRKDKVEIKHIGLHNVYNALAAFAAVLSLGVNFDTALNGLENSNRVPGRLEKADSKGLNFDVIIDYAHTDDALRNVLSAIKEIKPSRIITVFGCGGDRDRLKRPKMGEIAAKMSDFVFITSDNPRTEDPEKIILDIEVGLKRNKLLNYKVVVDRETAIKEAVMMASRGDIILLAGKGHEDYQIIGNQKKHFDDKEIAEKYIDQRAQLKKKIKRIPQGEFDFDAIS